MDYQYYKRLFISIVGIYSVYLNFGLVQEKMYNCNFFILLLDIDTKVVMEVVLSIHLFYFLYSVQLTY